MAERSETPVKDSGPRNAVSLSAGGNDPAGLQVGGTAAVTLAGTAGVNVGGTAGVNLGGATGVTLQLGPVRLTPNLQLTFSLFGIPIWSIQISGTATLDP